MPRYKRTRDEAGLDAQSEPEGPPEQVATLTKLRNMWQFASLMQYIFLFGQVVKIDSDFDIEDLETECLMQSPSEKLVHIGLQLLKFVSSHRGLTPEIFDEYTRRQFVARAPHRNPFGEEEEPNKFNEFDVFTRIRVLQQLSTWTLGNVDRIRGMMPQDEDHLNWRMEPLGWDSHDRAYFVLDDDRLYRRADEPLPPPSPKPKPKAKSKSSRKSKSKPTRSSKRRKLEEGSDEELDDAGDEDAQKPTAVMNGEEIRLEEEEPGYGFTSKTWECVAITLPEYQELMSILRARDPNEKQLRNRLEEEVVPIIEKRTEALKQKQLRKLRELENLQKLATAKRSNRLADKAERERQDREEREAEEKRERELKMALEEQEKQRKIEEGHESRRLTREQRLKEREVKRILHEEELAKIEEEANRASSQAPSSEAAENSKRMSERQLKTQKEQHRAELAKLAQEEDNWVFDCAVCGVHGENIDDGSHSIACERCSVWQHSKCHGLTPEQADSDDTHFICRTCKRKEANAKKPKIAPMKLSNKKSVSSPESKKPASRPTTSSGPRDSGLPPHVQRQLDGVYIPPPSPGSFGLIADGPSLSPYGQQQGPPGYRYPPVGNFAPHPPHSPQRPWQGNPLPPPARLSPSGHAISPPPPMANGYGPSHQQQHHYAHQQAVSHAGPYPNYQPYYQPQFQPPPNAQSPRTSYGQNPTAQQYHLPQSSHSQPQAPPPQHQLQQQQHHGSGQLLNGFQSPQKAAVKASSSPPQHQRHLSNGQPFESSPRPQGYASSPHTSFLPPSSASQQPREPSPANSSPMTAVYHPSPHSQLRPQIAQTPQNIRPPSANGYASAHQTPQMHPSPASANGNNVAAYGMSGPWPASSKTIPQKHDQSPAPPSSSQSVGGTKIVQPVPPLAPSPGQQFQGSQTGPQSVPVKKIAETNGTSPGPAPLVNMSSVMPSPSQKMQPATSMGASLPAGTDSQANGNTTAAISVMHDSVESELGKEA